MTGSAGKIELRPTKETGHLTNAQSLLFSTALCFLWCQSGFAAPPEYSNCVSSDQSSTKSPDDRISSCTVAIESQKLLNAELGKARAARAAAYKSTGNYDEALQDYKDASELDKSNPDLFFEVGNLYAAIRDTDHALEAYDRAIELKPSFAEALTNRCYIHNLKKESNAAITDCEKVSKLDPRLTQASIGLAIAYQDKKQCRTALTYYSHVLEEDGKNVNALMGRATCYDALDERKQAIEDYTEVIFLTRRGHLLGIIVVGQERSQESWNQLSMIVVVRWSYVRIIQRPSTAEG